MNTQPTDKRFDEDKDFNPDPITGAPGSHPVGTGVGAAGGAAAGAAIGVVGGPVGMAAGGVVGAIVGGLAGKGVAEAFDPTAEEAYWQDQYRKEPYFKESYDYNDYGPAYRYGMDRHDPETTFESAERDLGDGWDGARGDSRLEWERAREAARASWDRVHRPGSDRQVADQERSRQL